MYFPERGCTNGPDKCVCLSGQKGALAKVESEVNISVRHIAHDVQCIRSTMAIATVVWIKMSD